MTDESAMNELEQLLTIDEEKLLHEWKAQSILLMQAVRLFGRTQAAVSQLELITKGFALKIGNISSPLWSCSK